jgi:hypothetical protein
MYTLRRRGLAARVGTAVVAIGAIAAMALPGASAATTRSPSLSPSSTAPASHTVSAATTPSPSSTASTSHTKCVTTGLGSTCTGTYGGDNAWNPWAGTTGAQISHPPVVTVSQTKYLTDQVVNVNWQYFTPTIQPNYAYGVTSYQVNIYECKGTNPAVNVNGLSDSCAEIPVGSPNVQTGIPNALLGQNTFAPGTNGIPESWGGPPSATGGNSADWKGQAQFHIEVGQENSLLGCDVGTPCSLAIVPNFGGNYVRVNGAGSNTDITQCENHSNDNPNGNAPFDSSENSYACEYMDRIIVPLHFAPTASNCPQNAYQFYAEGSPMLSRAMAQWQAAWCSSAAPVSLHYTSADESQARGDFLQGGQLLSARTDMAMVTLPPDAAQTSSRKFTYAPLANSGVAIAYYLDNGATKQQINQVVLNPRLAAKLTTESYSLNYDCRTPPPNDGGGWPPLPKPSRTCDPAVSYNPPSLFDDQEFLSLNKNCQQTTTAGGLLPSPESVCVYGHGDIRQGAFLPTVLGGNSDMTYQLTNWVAANADATGFLAGEADPWGMHVNTNYWKAKISYPTQYFQSSLDPGTKYPKPLTCVLGSCSTVQGSVDATMNVAWNPVTPLSAVVNNLLAFQPNAHDVYLACPTTVSTCTSINQLSFPALPPDGLGGRNLFSEVDLGDVGAYQFPAAAMVNAAGQAVPPTQASVEAAVKDMKTNPDGITQYANESSTDKAAYPLAMVNYAMVPTCGLPSSEASAIANFLDKVATTGQTQGNVPGDLAPGYYPLTSAQRAQTLKAAQEVKAQDCKSAPKDTTVSGHPGVNNTSGRPGSTGTPNGTGTTSPPPAHGTSGKGPSSAAKTPAAGKAQTAAFGQKSPDSGMTGILLLLAIIVGAILLVGGPAAWALTATGKWPVVLRWLRPVQARLRAALAWLTGLAVRRA